VDLAAERIENLPGQVQEVRLILLPEGPFVQFASRNLDLFSRKDR
jgi:hypothetical protein